MVTKKIKTKTKIKIQAKKKVAKQKIKVKHPLDYKNSMQSIIKAKGPVSREKKESDLPVSKEDMIKIILQCEGLVKYIAIALNQSYSAVACWKEKFDWMKEAIELAREQNIDIAEHNLMKNVRARKEYSITWLLGILGQKRGYQKIDKLEHSLNQPYEKLPSKDLERKIKKTKDAIDILKNKE